MTQERESQALQRTLQAATRNPTRRDLVCALGAITIGARVGSSANGRAFAASDNVPAPIRTSWRAGARPMGSSHSLCRPSQPPWARIAVSSTCATLSNAARPIRMGIQQLPIGGVMGEAVGAANPSRKRWASRCSRKRSPMQRRFSLKTLIQQHRASSTPRWNARSSDTAPLSTHRFITAAASTEFWKPQFEIDRGNGRRATER